jgi:ABC-type multidrug transport system ATPase subunit
VIFGILGPNGAGKTTTLRILTTLLRPTSGSVRILGHDVVGSPMDVRRNIVAVLQENAVEGFLSVMDNFRTFGRFHGVPRKSIEELAGKAMERFGLTEHRNDKALDLSGGLKRRIQVAKAFMVDSPILFLDEPTTGMDAIHKRTTLDAIRSEADRGRTIVLTTHMLEEAEELCDDLVIINHGRIIATGSPASIRALSLNLYYLAIGFRNVGPEIVNLLRGCAPVNLEVKGNEIILTLRNHEEALGILDTARTAGEVVSFNIEGASLEEAFLQLIDASQREAG